MSIDGSQTTIVSASRQCQDRISQCLSSAPLQHKGWAEAKSAEYQYWTNVTGALARGNASLDKRLVVAEELDIRRTIINLLRLLSVLLDDCVNQAHTANVGTHNMDTWSDRTSRTLQDAMLNVDKTLNDLLRLAVAIRKSGLASRMLKADRSFISSKYPDLEQHLVMLLASQTPSKLESLKAAWRSNRGTAYHEASAIHPPITSVQRRLIDANLRRRHRFIYAQRHALKLGLVLDGEAIDTPAPADVNSAGIVDDTTTTTAPSGNSGRPQAGLARVAFTETNASTIRTPIRTAAETTTPSQQAKTTISTTASRLLYPLPPKVNETSLAFSCPCCCLPQAADLSKNLGKWRNHISEDVRPYTCIIEHCSKAEETYVSRSAWSEHMETEHTGYEQWMCLLCEDEPSFQQRSDIELHLKNRHHDSVLDIKTFAEMCVVSSPPQISACPLCSWVEHQHPSPAEAAILDHVAEHVHSFALISLPWLEHAPTDGTPLDPILDDRVREWVESQRTEEHELMVNEDCPSESPDLPLYPDITDLLQHGYFSGSAANGSAVETRTGYFDHSQHPYFGEDDAISAKASAPSISSSPAWSSSSADVSDIDDGDDQPQSVMSSLQAHDRHHDETPLAHAVLEKPACAYCGRRPNSSGEPSCRHEVQNMIRICDDTCKRVRGKEIIGRNDYTYARQGVITLATGHIIDYFNRRVVKRRRERSRRLEHVARLPCYAVYMQYHGRPPSRMVPSSYALAISDGIQRADRKYFSAIDRDWIEATEHLRNVFENLWSGAQVDSSTHDQQRGLRISPPGDAVIRGKHSGLRTHHDNLPASVMPGVVSETANRTCSTDIELDTDTEGGGTADDREGRPRPISSAHGDLDQSNLLTAPDNPGRPAHLRKLRCARFKLMALSAFLHMIPEYEGGDRATVGKGSKSHSPYRHRNLRQARYKLIAVSTFLRMLSPRHRAQRDFHNQESSVGPMHPRLQFPSSLWRKLHRARVKLMAVSAFQGVPKTIIGGHSPLTGSTPSVGSSDAIIAKEDLVTEPWTASQDPSLRLPRFLRQSRADLSSTFVDLEWQQRERLAAGLQLETQSEWARTSGPGDSLVRNRYLNIEPFEGNRVKLRVPEGANDYINASPIMLHGVKYIATQGPKQSTVSHFYRMIAAETKDVAVVVMLTQTHEAGREKCYLYWPPDKSSEPLMLVPDGVSDEFEGSVHFISNLVHDKSKAQYTHLRMRIRWSQTSEWIEKHVWHVHFQAWPDFSAPDGEDRSALVEMIRVVRSLRRGQNLEDALSSKSVANVTQGLSLASDPLIVHCSAGVGRTGTYIVLDHFIHLLDEKFPPDTIEEGDDPIAEAVDRLRQQRMMMVQGESQFIFLYDAIREIWNTQADPAFRTLLAELRQLKEDQRRADEDRRFQDREARIRMEAEVKAIEKLRADLQARKEAEANMQVAEHTAAGNQAKEN